MTKWVCECCGQTGNTAWDVSTDEVQCPDCGEAVTPDGRR